MTRVQVLLTEEQDQKLESLARALRTSKARLVREGVDLLLRRKIPGRRDPLLELIGRAGRIGRSDVSASHDAYLTSWRLRRRRR
jgi:Ribbon-helix-helix domain